MNEYTTLVSQMAWATAESIWAQVKEAFNIHEDAIKYALMQRINQDVESDEFKVLENFEVKNNES